MVHEKGNIEENLCEWLQVEFLSEFYTHGLVDCRYVGVLDVRFLSQNGTTDYLVGDNYDDGGDSLIEP
jgi:hypothetical protein